jgi:oxygen-independent coproporphyrinogen-3 oxidase
MADETRDRLLRYNQAVPRYTSYPTAPHFKAVDTDAAHREWLGALPPGEAVSLYFHIPFCAQLCWFCGCHTKITRRYAPVRDYIAQLRREIAMVSAAMRTAPPVRHIHFGGGSPSIMAHDDFIDFMALVRGSFNVAPDAEIAVEMDPRHAGEVKIAACAKAGVTRMSFGVQDFDEKILTAVNRPQPFSCTYDAVLLCREYGIGGINMDFMYGLPFQTMDTMRRTMDIALALMPDRLSLFGYAHVPWMKKHMRLIPERALPGPELRYELF